MGGYIQGGPPKQNSFIKNCVFILTCLSFSYLQSTLHLMQYTYRDTFPTVHNRTFLKFLILMLFSASAYFCFSSTLAKRFPFKDFFFHLGKQKKSLWARLGEWGGWVTGVILGFGQKLLNTQQGMGGCTCKSPIMKWANALSLPKKSTEAEHSLSQQHQLVH